MEELDRRIKASGSMTAAELDELLNSCPEWVEQNRRREERRKTAEERFRVEEEPIIRDLAAVGYEVGSVYDLVNTSESYREAIAVLIEHLARPYHPRIRQGIGRALAVREAEGLAGPAILRELEREQDPETRWVLGNTLTIVADRHDADRIKALVEDPRFEDVHERLTQALKNVT